MEPWILIVFLVVFCFILLYAFYNVYNGISGIDTDSYDVKYQLNYLSKRISKAKARGYRVKAKNAEKTNIENLIDQYKDGLNL